MTSFFLLAISYFDARIIETPFPASFVVSPEFLGLGSVDFINSSSTKNVSFPLSQNHINFFNSLESISIPSCEVFTSTIRRPNPFLFATRLILDGQNRKHDDDLAGCLLSSIKQLPNLQHLHFTNFPHLTKQFLRHHVKKRFLGQTEEEIIVANTEGAKNDDVEEGSAEDSPTDETTKKGPSSAKHVLQTVTFSACNVSNEQVSDFGPSESCCIFDLYLEMLFVTEDVAEFNITTVPESCVLATLSQIANHPQATKFLIRQFKDRFSVSRSCRKLLFVLSQIAMDLSWKDIEINVLALRSLTRMIGFYTFEQQEDDDDLLQFSTCPNFPKDFEDDDDDVETGRAGEGAGILSAVRFCLNYVSVEVQSEAMKLLFTILTGKQFHDNAEDFTTNKNYQNDFISTLEISSLSTNPIATFRIAEFFSPPFCHHDVDESILSLVINIARECSKRPQTESRAVKTAIPSMMIISALTFCMAPFGRHFMKSIVFDKWKLMDDILPWAIGFDPDWHFFEEENYNHNDNCSSVFHRTMQDWKVIREVRDLAFQILKCLLLVRVDNENGLKEMLLRGAGSLLDNDNNDELTSYRKIFHQLCGKSCLRVDLQYGTPDSFFDCIYQLVPLIENNNNNNLVVAPTKTRFLVDTFGFAEKIIQNGLLENLMSQIQNYDSLFKREYFKTLEIGYLQQRKDGIEREEFLRVLRREKERRDRDPDADRTNDDWEDYQEAKRIERLNKIETQYQIDFPMPIMKLDSDQLRRGLMKNEFARKCAVLLAHFIQIDLLLQDELRQLAQVVDLAENNQRQESHSSSSPQRSMSFGTYQTFRSLVKFQTEVNSVRMRVRGYAMCFPSLVSAIKMMIEDSAVECMKTNANHLVSSQASDVQEENYSSFIWNFCFGVV